MSFESNIVPKIIGLYDEELFISHFPPNNLGSFIKRNNLQNAHHISTSIIYHPTLNNVVNCFNGHMFLNGNIRVEWEWETGQIPEYDIDNYLQEINIPNYTFTKNLAENKLYADISADWISNDWINNHLNWQISAPKAKLILNSSDAEMLCVTRLNNSYLNYNFSNRTISPGEILEIQKPNSHKCYLIFSEIVENLELNKKLKRLKMYELVSPSIQIKNLQNKYVKVFRFIK